MGNHPALTLLECNNNQLESLDVSGCTALWLLYCNNNLLDADALNALFGTLHDNDVGQKYVYIRNNPGWYDCDRSIAEAKGWYVYYY